MTEPARLTQPDYDARPVAAAGERLPPWWLFLVTGFVWVVFSFIVLQFDFGTVAAIAVYAGLAFMAYGVNEFLAALYIPGWRWLRVAFGLLFIGAGLWALIRPVEAFASLTAAVSLVLLFKGTLDIVTALASRQTELWWLYLVAGFIEICVGLWAAGYPGRSVWLLVLWVGITTMVRGVTEIVLAFQCRSGILPAV